MAYELSGRAGCFKITHQTKKMKKSLYTFIFFYAIVMVSCSEQSPIEGLIDTKPTVTAINAEITAGSNKTIALTVNNKTLNLEIKNTTVTNGGFETRHCIITMLSNAGVFPIGGNSAYINAMEAGTEISASVFSHPSYSGSLFFITRPVNTSNYSYVNTNGIRYGNSYYIPLKIAPNNNQDTPIYAYMQFTVATERIVLNKMVYQNVGNLSAGGE